VQLAVRACLRGIFAAMMMLGALAIPPVEAGEAVPSHFMVFDGLLFLGKPDLRIYGLTPILGSGDLWRAGVSRDDVDPVRLAAIFQSLKDSDGYYYLDIERWPLENVAPEVRAQNVAKLTHAISIARANAPHLHIGFYGLLPGITYWPLMRHDEAYLRWKQSNAALDVLAPSVDAVFPSLYTFYDDPAGWASYARQTLVEARRYGKPVYAFIWPEYHDSNPVLGGQMVPSEAWRAELELCFALADGVVIWGGSQHHWDANAPWWTQTLAFVQAHGLRREMAAPD
jgi:hypothetical protein